jgi:hypothetical protein
MLPTSYLNDTKIFYLFLQNRILKVVECIQSDEDATMAATYVKFMLEVLGGDLGLSAIGTTIIYLPQNKVS